MLALQRAVLNAQGPQTEGTDAELWTSILTGKKPGEGLQRLSDEGVLAATFPELHAMVGFGGRDQGHKDLWDHTLKVVAQTKNRPTLRWAALFHDVGKPVSFSREHGKVTFHQHEYASARLLKEAMHRTEYLQGPDLNEVYFLVRHLGLVESYAPDWKDSAVRRVYRKLGDHFEDVLLLARADNTSKHAHKRQRVHSLLHELRERALQIAEQDAVVPPLPKGLGDALMASFRVPPSKKLGDIKRALEARIEAGDLEAHQPVDFYVDYLTTHQADFDL